MKLLIKIVQNLTGLTIDHFVRGLAARLLPDRPGAGPAPGLPEPARPKDSVLGDRPAGRGLDAQRPAGAVLRPPAARPAPRRPRPRGAPAVLPVDRAAQGQLDRRAAQPGQADTRCSRRSALRWRPTPGWTCSTFADQFRRRLRRQASSFATIPITGTPTIRDSSGNDVSIVAVDFAALPAFFAQRRSATPSALHRRHGGRPRRRHGPGGQRHRDAAASPPAPAGADAARLPVSGHLQRHQRRRRSPR